MWISGNFRGRPWRKRCGDRIGIAEGTENDLLFFAGYVDGKTADISLAVAPDRTEHRRNLELADALARLHADLQNRNSAQNLAVGLEALPLSGESYGIVRDFCTWEEGQKAECLDLLSRQPAANRIHLLAAMKSLGSSRDVILLHKLANAQHKIAKLRKYANCMNPQNICRAVEGRERLPPEEAVLRLTAGPETPD